MNEIAKLTIELLEEVQGQHCDTESGSYAECEQEGEQCLWCADADKVIEKLKNVT